MTSSENLWYVWVCRCGAETPTTPEKTRLGAVFNCEECNTTWGCVTTARGPSVWVEISPDEVEFHGLLEEGDNEDE